MNESEHSDELFDFLYKTSNNTCQDSATKIFESFVDQKPQGKLVHLESNFKNDALKMSLFDINIILNCLQMQRLKECFLQGKTY